MKIAFLITITFLFLSSTIVSQVDINNKIMLAQSFEQAGNYDKAITIFEEIYSAQPQNYLVFESLNRVYVQSKKYDNSIKLIEARIKQDSRDVNLYGMLGTTYYLMGNENKAYETWEDGIEIQPENQMSYRVIANFAIQRRAFDKAIDFLKRGKAISQNPDLFSYDLANIYALTMQFKEAAEEYCLILSLQPTQLSTIENRILTYSQKPGALSETIEVLENWSKDDNISFDYLLARLYMEAKSFDKAYSIYLSIDERQQNKGLELYNFAQIAFNEGEYLLASKVYRDIINKYPESPYSSGSKLGYAKTLESILDKEAALVNPNWKPMSQSYLTDALQTNSVINSYIELSNAYPYSDIAFESYFRIGKIYFTKIGSLSEAKKYFERITQDASMSRFAVESLEQLGKIFIIEGDLKKAKDNFEKIISNARALDENRNYANYQIARINLFEGNFSEAKARLSKIITNLKDNTTNDAIELSLLLNTAAVDSSNLLKFGKAEFLTEQKKYSEAAEEYNKIASDPYAFILHHISKLREAEVELAMDNLDKSIGLLEKITEEAEKNIYADKALYLLSRIYQYGKKNYPKAIESYELLLAKFPNSLYLDDSRNAIIELRNKLS
jgi:tetratricopeptide (TPR) repeat protein